MIYRPVIYDRILLVSAFVEHVARSACAERREKVEEGKLTHLAQLSHIPLQTIRLLDRISRYEDFT